MTEHCIVHILTAVVCLVLIRDTIQLLKIRVLRDSEKARDKERESKALGGKMAASQGNMGALAVGEKGHDESDDSGHGKIGSNDGDNDGEISKDMYRDPEIEWIGPAIRTDETTKHVYYQSVLKDGLKISLGKNATVSLIYFSDFLLLFQLFIVLLVLPLIFVNRGHRISDSFGTWCRALYWSSE